MGEELTMAKIAEANKKMAEEYELTHWEQLFGKSARVKIVNYIMSLDPEKLFTAADVADAVGIKEDTSNEHLGELEKDFGFIGSQEVSGGRVTVFCIERDSNIYRPLYNLDAQLTRLLRRRE